MQSTDTVMLVKPAQFGYNSETEMSNSFQRIMPTQDDAVKKQALEEFNRMVGRLKERGIRVIVVEDTKSPLKPDAVFPNNWISFHADGTVVLYPMLAPNRRLERRQDIISMLRSQFEVKQLIDLSMYEKEQLFLEGTGSIVFDHMSRIAYACRSSRTNRMLFEKLCEAIAYAPIFFEALDNEGQYIYHTNVMMNIGTAYAVVCLESIQDEVERTSVVRSLEQSGRLVIPISYEQMNTFCANMLELKLREQKKLLTMSSSAYKKLTNEQRTALEGFCELFPLNVKTIERIAGGSVRCMIAEIFLPKKKVNALSC